jgi:hypothetical protein
MGERQAADQPQHNGRCTKEGLARGLGLQESHGLI